MRSLRRPKFVRVLTEDRRKDILELLAAAAILIQPDVAIHDCRDVKDNKHPELALAAGAKIIVSSDADLLDLDPWRGIRMLRPAELLVRA